MCGGVVLLGIGVLVGRLTGSGAPGNESGEVAMRIPHSKGSLLSIPPVEANPGATGGKGNVPGKKKLASTTQNLLNLFNSPGSDVMTNFQNALRGMSAKRIGDVLVDIETLPNHARRRELRERLVDYLTMTNPVEALTLREKVSGQNILDKAFKQLGRNGLASAMKHIEALEDAGDRKSALVAAFVGASEIDPAQAFAALKTVPGVSRDHYHEVFDNWAETDPIAAATAALTVTSNEERRAALKIVGREWGEQDPQAVLQWLEGAALSASERQSIQKSALDGLIRRDPVAALELMPGLDTTMRNRLLPDTIRQLARKNPEAALEWIQNEPESYVKSKVVREAIGQLADKLPMETLELARTNPEIKDNAVGTAFSRLTREDLPLALKTLKEWEGDPMYRQALTNVAHSYAREDSEKAMIWAESLPADNKGEALRSIIESVVYNEDPQSAIKYLDRLSSEENSGNLQSAVSTISQRWVERDPAAAADWLQNFRGLDENGEQRAYSSLTNRWAQDDPIGASEWIAGLPESKGRDSAASVLAHRIRRDDPERAIAWAESISDDNNRNQTLQSVYREWMQTDPDSAMQSLNSSTLPEQTKSRWIQRQKRPQIE